MVADYIIERVIFGHLTVFNKICFNLLCVKTVY